MKRLLKVLLALAVLIPSASMASGFKLDAAIKNGASVEFLKFEGSGQWDNYLAMNLPFEPVAELFRQLLIKQRKQLTNRGEAHITVITPVEFWSSLRPRGITMDDINQIAGDLRIQNSEFEVICLGSGKATVDGALEETFFIVITSSDLLNIRRRVQQLLIARGGQPDEFEPTNFYPHITLGFTKRDLHESDGVIKGQNSCASGIELYSTL